MGFEAIEHLCYCVSITKHVLHNIHILIELLLHKTNSCDQNHSSIYVTIHALDCIYGCTSRIEGMNITAYQHSHLASVSEPHLLVIVVMCEFVVEQCRAVTHAANLTH